MKVEVTTKEKQFEPIELKLTIESNKELEILTSFFNSSDAQIAELLNKSKHYLSSNVTPSEINRALTPIWCQLNTLYQQLKS